MAGDIILRMFKQEGRRTALFPLIEIMGGCVKTS